MLSSRLDVFVTTFGPMLVFTWGDAWGGSKKWLIFRAKLAKLRKWQFDHKIANFAKHFRKIKQYAWDTISTMHTRIPSKHHANDAERPSKDMGQSARVRIETNHVKIDSSRSQDDHHACIKTKKK